MRKLVYRIVKDAIDFAFTNPAVIKWLNVRDQDPRFTISEIRSTIMNDSNGSVEILVGINYSFIESTNLKNEDVLVELKWDKATGFHIVRISPTNLKP